MASKPIDNKKTSESTSMRIAKRIAAAGLCSRRDAEQWIADGRVSVDGEIITSPALNVTDTSVIIVDGQLLPSIQQPRLWGYYKPVGVVTTHRDPEGRPTLFECLPEGLPRVISIGRLDLNSEGLILLTTSSDIARFAELPVNQWPRCYKVRVFGEVDEQALADLEHGITVDGIHYSGIQAEVIRYSGMNAWLSVTLYEGKNREIRKVLNHLNLRVNRLIRLAYGPFHLGDHQPEDLWEISKTEMEKAFPFIRKSKQETLTLKKPPVKSKKPHAHHRRKI